MNLKKEPHGHTALVTKKRIGNTSSLDKRQIVRDMTEDQAYTFRPFSEIGKVKKLIKTR